MEVQSLGRGASFLFLPLRRVSAEELVPEAKTMEHSYPHALTYRPQSSSFLGLPYRILNMNPKKELLWGLWVKKA